MDRKKKIFICSMVVCFLLAMAAMLAWLSKQDIQIAERCVGNGT